MDRRTRLVYQGLAAVWILLIAWQVLEHLRVKRTAKAELRNRAKDISNTVGLVLGSQRHVITKERLESALNSLIKPEELNAVAMLNAAGETVASAGPPISPELEHSLLSTGEHWGDRNFVLMNLVALGTNVTSEPESARPTIVVPRSELFNPNRGGTNRPGFGLGPNGAPPPERLDQPPPPTTGVESQSGTNTGATAGASRPRREADGRPPFRRPPGMTEQEFKSIIEKKGVHRVVIMMSAQPMYDASNHDLWLRLFISGLASLSVVGLALAWTNVVKSGELELRLVRAAELNTRLREMNLAAAGLAHETKNPLNIIRGLAQLISKQDDAPTQVRTRSVAIINEADRVTAQVNEFINFSRPRQLRPVPVSLQAAVGEVVRALGPDLEEKRISLQVDSDLPKIEADEQQLRQALFNLLINATQAVEPGGAIHVSGGRNASGGFLEIRDTGPGVPPEHRTDVFKPYFTTNQKGSGLGLAVVQQIVLGHGWEIECLPNEPRGALFRLSHLRLASAA